MPFKIFQHSYMVIGYKFHFIFSCQWSSRVSRPLVSVFFVGGYVIFIEYRQFALSLNRGNNYVIKVTAGATCRLLLRINSPAGCQGIFVRKYTLNKNIIKPQGLTGLFSPIHKYTTIHVYDYITPVLIYWSHPKESCFCGFTVHVSEFGHYISHIQ